MYDADTKCGVLTDFDLSILQWEPRIIGTDRTGTVPFMAIDLLTEDYWRGFTKRYYRHELEAFIWILPFTFLLYQGGMRLSNQYVDPWRTSDYNVCSEKKSHFLQQTGLFKTAGTTVQNDFKEFWDLVHGLSRVLVTATKARGDRDYEAIMQPIDSRTGTAATNAAEDCKEFWDLFISALDKYIIRIAVQHRSEFSALVTRLKTHEPDFTELTKEQAALLKVKYALFLRDPQAASSEQ